MATTGADAADLGERLARIEGLLAELVRGRTVKEWYTTAEVAALVGRAEYTVREWCRQGRVRAAKAAAGRGPHPAWRVSHAELERLRNDGLRPTGRQEPTAVERTTSQFFCPADGSPAS